VAYRKFQQVTLKTERFAPKTLKIFRSGTGVYYLSYTVPATKDYATRVYKLLLVNDPALAPQVLSLGP
jgi:hypothetical protein